MIKTRNQAGFAHLEKLLLGVIVLIIVGVGWYVWHSVSQANKNLNSAANTNNAVGSKKKTTQTSTNPISKSPSKATTINPSSIPASIVSNNPAYVTETPTAVNNFITINEWNVKFKQNGTITIMYAHDVNDKSAHAAFFTSSQLLAKNKACKVEIYPAGYIVRFKSDENVADAKGSDSGKAAKDYVAANPNDSYKQIGDYYYFYRGPVAKCSQLKELQDLQDQTAAAVQAFLQSLEVVAAQ
jgi:cytoskeletal protein RodZ